MGTNKKSAAGFRAALFDICGLDNGSGKAESGEAPAPMRGTGAAPQYR